MEVFGVGPFELLLVIIISFIILGPERIPDVARTVGKTIRQVRQSIQQLTTESGGKINVADDLAALRREVMGLQKDLTNVTKGILQPVDQPTAPKDSAAPALNPNQTPTPSTPVSTNSTPSASSDSDIIDMGAPPTA